MLGNRYNSTRGLVQCEWTCLKKKKSTQPSTRRHSGPKRGGNGLPPSPPSTHKKCKIIHPFKYTKFRNLKFVARQYEVNDEASLNYTNICYTIYYNETFIVHEKLLLLLLLLLHIVKRRTLDERTKRGGQ